MPFIGTRQIEFIIPFYLFLVGERDYFVLQNLFYLSNLEINKNTMMMILFFFHLLLYCIIYCYIQNSSLINLDTKSKSF